MNTLSPAAPKGATPEVSPGSLAAQRAKSLLRYARWTDPAVMLVWVLVTTVPMDSAAPLRYLCVAYFMAGLAIFAKETLPTYVRAWPTLLIPILCVISAVWAPSSGEAFRKGLLMALTGTVAVYAASRLTVRQIVSIYFLGEIYGAVLSVMHPNLADGAWTGVFAQKNFLAVHMFILYMTGLVILLDKQSNRWLRGSTLLFIPMAAALIFLSKSATTILLFGATTAAVIGHTFIWEPASRVKHMRTVFVALMILLALTAGLLLFGLFQFDVMDTILRSFGKDSTLTGRTFIWDWGYRIMNEHPWTGVGANGFWQPNVGIANQILTFFYYDQFTKFSFHNSYIENGVQLGYPGYFATYFVAAWGLWSTIRTWVRNQTLLNAAFLVLAVMVLIRSNSEIDLAQELNATAVLFFIGAVRREDLRKRAPALLPPRPMALRQGSWRNKP